MGRKNKIKGWAIDGRTAQASKYVKGDSNINGGARQKGSGTVHGGENKSSTPV